MSYFALKCALLQRWVMGGGCEWMRVRGQQEETTEKEETIEVLQRRRREERRGWREARTTAKDAKRAGRGSRGRWGSSAFARQHRLHKAEKCDPTVERSSLTFSRSRSTGAASSRMRPDFAAVEVMVSRGCTQFQPGMCSRCSRRCTRDAKGHERETTHSTESHY